MGGAWAGSLGKEFWTGADFRGACQGRGTDAKGVEAGIELAIEQVARSRCGRQGARQERARARSLNCRCARRVSRRPAPSSPARRKALGSRTGASETSSAAGGARHGWAATQLKRAEPRIPDCCCSIRSAAAGRHDGEGVGGRSRTFRERDARRNNRAPRLGSAAGRRSNRPAQGRFLVGRVAGQTTNVKRLGPRPRAGGRPSISNNRRRGGQRNDRNPTEGCDAGLAPQRSTACNRFSN